MIALKITVFLVGLWLVIKTINSALRTFVLPRSAPDRLTSFVFRWLRSLFNLRLRFVQDYIREDTIMAMYAPLAVMALLPAWLALVLIGYTGMFWATGAGTLYESFILSGSSLFTLGFARSDPGTHLLLNYTESTIGLILVALLMAYLPTMYSAFSNRERTVNLLEVRAGSPPSAVEMILRFNRLNRLRELHHHWEEWEVWFAELQESHTSLAALVFFRSPQPQQSWVTAAGTILDAGALILAAVDVPQDMQINLCMRAGYLALRSIADFFNIPYNANPHFPDDDISVSRAEFDAACNRLAENGVALKADRDQAWLDFAGWRVNYDSALMALADLTMAPAAPWTSHRE
jgi:hypothetical protein